MAAAPRILQGPTSQGVDIEKNVSLPCSASGVPPPQVTWMRDGRYPVAQDERFTVLESGALYIHSEYGIRKCICIFYNRYTIIKMVSASCFELNIERYSKKRH